MGLFYTMEKTTERLWQNGLTDTVEKSWEASMAKGWTWTWPTRWEQWKAKVEKYIPVLAGFLLLHLSRLERRRRSQVLDKKSQLNLWREAFVSSGMANVTRPGLRGPKKHRFLNRSWTRLLKEFNVKNLKKGPDWLLCKKIGVFPHVA